MRGLKQDLEVLYALLDKDHANIMQFFRKYEYTLDYLFMNWLVCLFMSLDLSSKRKFEILQYVIQHKKRGLFRMVIFVLSENETNLFSCRSFAEIETKAKKFYNSLEDPFLFARLKKLQIDETIIQMKVRDFNHEFDPDQYVLVAEGQDRPRYWIEHSHYFLAYRTGEPSTRKNGTGDWVLKARTPIEMSTETIHKRYKNYLFPI
jgi:hypothetical protein